MSLNMVARVARPEDLDRLMALYSFLNPGDPPVSEAAANQIWKKLQMTDGILVLLGDVENEAATTCTLIIVPNLTRGGRPYAIIENVVTHPDYRKRGLGAAILAGCSEDPLAACGRRGLPGALSLM